MPAYDPTIQGLLARRKTDWGDPLEKRKGLVPYGIAPVDLALYGLDIVNGELIVIMGPQKQRKSTFAANIVANIMTGKLPEIKPMVVIDTLESGMQPGRYRDTLTSIIASRYLHSLGHSRNKKCPICGVECKEMLLSPDYMIYNTKTPAQEDAIEYADNVMNEWPLLIYGADPEEGDTRNLEASVKSKKSRWRELAKTGAKIFVSDHVQQYSFDTELTDYEKQLRSVAAISDVVAQNKIVAIVLSQVSLGSVKEARQFIGKMNAAGGTKLQQEANVTFSTAYTQGGGTMKITIEESRKSSTLTIWQPIDDISGAFIGKPNSSHE